MNDVTQWCALGLTLCLIGCVASPQVVGDEDEALSKALSGQPGPPLSGAALIIDPDAPNDMSAFLKPSSSQCTESVLPVAPAPFEPQKTGEVSWMIHERGVGDIIVGAPVPPSVLALEGKTYKALYFDPMEGKDEMAMMMSGLMDQDGYRTIRLSKLDLTLRMTLKDRILDLDPGAKIRTPQGTGVGSTLGELIGAHGDYTLSRIPEPHECAVLFKSVKGVAFQFKSCEAACAGEPVVNVYVSGGYDPPDDEVH